jgi:1-acyl-sn-glycerol-3-phosphate acyltransferase
MKLFYLTPFLLQKCIWVPTHIALSVFGKIKIEGLEHLRDVKGATIFAANHTSELDAFIVASSVPFWSHFSPLFFASRENKFYDTSGWRRHFYGGMFFKLWGAQAIYSGLQDYEKSLINHIQLLKDGKSLLLFPEGRITPDGSVQSARGGVAYLASRMNCTIVPVAISGAYNMTIADFFLRHRKILIRFGAPIHSDELDITVRQDSHVSENVYKKEAAYIMERVRELFH